MQTLAVSYNGATLVLARPTVRTRLNEDVIAARLGVDALPPGTQRYYAVAFAAFAAHVVSIDRPDLLGFDLPSLADDEGAWKAALEAWLDSGADLLRQVDAAMRQLRLPPGGTAYSPEAGEAEKNG